MKRFVILLIGLLMFLPPAQALLWWGDDPVDTPPAEQTEKARPIFEEALAAHKAGRERKAVKLYGKISKKYPASGFSAQALYNTGVIQYGRKKWKKSFNAFQDVLIKHPDYPRFNQLVDYQFRIALANAEGDGVRFLWVIPMRALNRSVEQFEIVVRNAPYSDLAPLALMNAALIHQHKNETAEAIDALDRLINNYPSSLLADDAYFALAETFSTLVQGAEYDQGATREAISYFEDFLILFSRNERVARAEQGLAEMRDVYARSKLVIGQYYFKYRRWYQASEIFLNEAITIAPDSPAAASARELLARIQTIREQAKPPAEDSPERVREKSFIRRWYERVVS